MGLIFEGKTCRAEYVPEKKRVNYKFTGYADIEEHKKMYLKVIEEMKTRPFVATYNDMREMKGTFTQLNEWLIVNFKPAVERGYKHSALVLNNDIFTSFAAEAISKKVHVLEIRMFNDVKKAESWLDTKLEE